MVGVKTDTIKKAVRQGRLLLPEPDENDLVPTTKSLRSQVDSLQPMAKACVNTLERVLVSREGFQCLPMFQPEIDLSYGIQVKYSQNKVCNHAHGRTSRKGKQQKEVP